MDQVTADKLWHSPLLPARFWRKVEKADTGCWHWIACLSDGYGRFKIGDEYPGAHRYAYRVLVGEVPEGLVLDHLCRVRHCVNPAHLEVVTNRTNLMRGETHAAHNAAKTHCSKGHAFTPENTAYWGGNMTVRRCRTCQRRHRSEWGIRRAMKAASVSY